MQKTYNNLTEEGRDTRFLKVFRTYFEATLDEQNDRDGFIREGSEAIGKRNMREILDMLEREMSDMLKADS